MPRPERSSEDEIAAAEDDEIVDLEVASSKGAVIVDIYLDLLVCPVETLIDDAVAAGSFVVAFAAVDGVADAFSRTRDFW